MKQHQYEITVKHVADAQGNPSAYTETLQFTAYNHDDLFKVLQHIQKGNLLEGEKATAFAIGLKLFGETLLENKNHPLFKEMFSQITSYKIYNETVETYRNSPLYRNKDGSLNINKLKKEAIGKLIMQHIIKKENGGETSEKINKATFSY